MTSLLDAARGEELDERTEAMINVQDLAPSLQDAHITGRNRTKDDTVETVMLPRHDHQPFVYPAWPTSTPGPQAISPPPGQRPFPRRTDQMMYACYDQERGMPCAPPPTEDVRENGTRMYLSDASLQKGTLEAEAMARWHEDGSTSDKEAMAWWHEAGGASEAEAMARWHDDGGR
jgi:hypothetical protein